MALIRLKRPRPMFRRVMRPQDYALLGIASTVSHTWEAANRFTVDMSDAVGDPLVAALPEEFFRLDDPVPPVIDAPIEHAPKASGRSHRAPKEPVIVPDDEGAQLALDVNPVD